MSIAYNRQREASNKRFVTAVRETAGCIDCEVGTGLLHFDHRDPAEKSFNVGTGGTRAIGTLLVEIMKCDVRCASCHARRHIQDDPEKMVRAGRRGGAAGKGKARPWQTPEWYAARRKALL